MAPTQTQVTELLLRWSKGDQRALDALVPLVYEDLRRLAGYYLKQEARAQTLQSTALVHEVYLRLCGQQDPEWQGRAHFFAVAAKMIRRILVDHARQKSAAKRGGSVQSDGLDEAITIPVQANVDTLRCYRRRLQKSRTVFSCASAPPTLSRHQAPSFRPHGPEHPRTIGVMDDLAEALSHQRKFAEAENLRRETLALYRRVLGPEHPDTLISMANLAETYALEGRPAEAEKLYQKTLEVQRRVLGPDNPDTATTTYDLAFVAIRRGDRERAFRLFREALDHGLPPEYSMTIEADPELISLHGDPRFERLVARAKELAAVGQGKR